MDRNADTLSLHWAALRAELSAPTPLSASLPEAPILAHRRSHSILDRAIFLCHFAQLWTGINALSFTLFLYFIPHIYLRLALLLLIAATLYELIDLYRITRLLHRSKSDLATPIAVFARAAAGRLAAWRRSADRRSLWLLPFSLTTGLLLGLLLGHAERHPELYPGGLAADPDGLFLAALPTEPATWILLIAFLLISTIAGRAAGRWMTERTFGDVETRLREWAEDDV
jgi:hypothetical protein